MQQTISDKKEAFKTWQRSRLEEDRMAYRVKNREAKRAVAQAKREALDSWCENLDSPEGKKKMFAMAKQLKKDKKDIVGGYFIKNDAGEIVTDESGIQEVWKEYFSTLLNEENPNVIPGECCVEGPIADVSEAEVERALRAMKANKAPGPSDVSSDLFKYAGRTGLTQITKVFQQIMDSRGMPRRVERQYNIAVFQGQG